MLISATKNNSDKTSSNRTKMTRKQKWENEQTKSHTSKLGHDKEREALKEKPNLF